MVAVVSGIMSNLLRPFGKKLMKFVREADTSPPSVPIPTHVRIWLGHDRPAVQIFAEYVQMVLR